MAEELEGYLAELTREGVIDSQGRFTLDMERARQKMDRYRFLDPAHYILSLVRAAVLGHATAIAVEVDGHSVAVLFDGDDFSDYQIRRLFGALLEDRLAPSDVRLHHLAAGVQGALGFGGGDVDIFLPESPVYRFQPGRLEPVMVRRPALKGDHKFQVQVRRGLSLLQRLVSFANQEEADVVREYCRLCPLPLTVNGDSIPRAQYLPQDFVYRPDLNPGLEILWDRLPKVIPDLEELNLTVLGGIVDWEPGRVSFVVAGVSTSLRTIPGLPGLDAVVFFDDAVVDLSQSHLVEEERYEEVLAGLARFYFQLVRTPKLTHPLIDVRLLSIAQLRELSAAANLSDGQRAVVAKLEQEPLFVIDSPRHGEPKAVNLVELRSAERLFCLADSVPLKVEGFRYPETIRLIDRSHAAAKLLDVCGLVWDNEIGLRRGLNKQPNLLTQSERRRAVEVFLGTSRWTENGLLIPTAGSGSLELSRGLLRGPNLEGAVWHILARQITRLDIQELVLQGGDRRYYLLVSDGRETLVYFVEEDDLSIAILHAIPSFLGHPGRFERPDLVPQARLEDLV